MASGRVGGTKSKVSGKVGDVYYSTRRESDGSYTQVVSPMPETREDTLTPEVVRQRICMSICYKYMSALSYILVNSFDPRQPASLNLQEFVRVNVKRLKGLLDKEGDLPNQIWFYDYGDPFLYPAPIKMTFGDNLRDIAGTTIVGNKDGDWELIYGFSNVWNGISVEKWMSDNRQERGDVHVKLIQTVNRDPSLNTIYTIRIIVDPQMSLYNVLTPDNFHLLFRIESPFPIEWYRENIPSDVTWRMAFRVKKTDEIIGDAVGAICSLQSGYRNGKWLRSSSPMHTITPRSTNIVQKKDLVHVWESWYDDRL